MTGLTESAIRLTEHEGRSQRRTAGRGKAAGQATRHVVLIVMAVFTLSR